VTLIVAGANTQFAFLVSDRRFTYLNGTFDDEKNKATYFALRDVRLLVAFTGLAELGSFKTSEWLKRALARAAQPELLIEPTIGRFVDLASQRFAELPCTAGFKRLSIVFTGYWLGERPPRWCIFLVSNFQKEDDGESSEAQEVFSATRRVELRPHNQEAHSVLMAGARHSSMRPALLTIGELMKTRRPPAAVIGKAVNTIQEAAERSQGKGSIGSQCNSIYLLRENPGGAIAEYHSVAAKNVTYMPDSVILDGRMALINTGPRIEAFNADGTARPLAIPRVHRNSPCPCGSGKKYRECCKK
jgi:hypothetical protein